MTKLTLAWSMPNKWTFQMQPVKDFLDRWLVDAVVIIDPFSGETARGTMNNDLARGGIDAARWCESLLPEYESKADAVLFDPPYSPRQIKECYEGVGLKAMMADTQSGRLYREVRQSLAATLKPGGIALSFGWQSSGFGMEWPTLEIMLVRHGGPHNDTICVAQQKTDHQMQLF